MRSIKFRVWDKKEKTMNYSAEGRIVDGRLIAFDLMIEWRRNIYSSEWELMQFTGLLDKNGKEIFEGGIREGKYYFQTKEERGVEVMEWDNKNSCFYWKPVHGTIPDFIEIEVIGNIYENPELAGRTE